MRVQKKKKNKKMMGQRIKEDDTDGKGKRANDMRILAVRDRESEFQFANVIPTKGLCNYATNQVIGDTRILGHQEHTIKCDQEPAVQALRKQVRKQGISKEGVQEQRPH